MSPRDKPPEDDPFDDPADDGLIFVPVQLFLPAGGGNYLVVLPPELRRLLAERLQGLRGRLISESSDPQLQRLFPTAYNQHRELDEEYQRLMRSELLASRLSALDTVEQTIDADTITTDDLNQWLQSINALRLVLGTTLDVSEEGMRLEPDDPRVPDYELYELLNLLLSSIVDALRGGSEPKRMRFWRR